MTSLRSEERRAEKDVPGTISYLTRTNWPRFVFVTIMPSPYIRELFEAIAKRDEIECHVLYLEMQAPDTYWGDVPLPPWSEIVPGRWYWVLGARVHVNPGILCRIRELNPDVLVVAGYVSWTGQVIMLWSALTRRKWIFWGEIPGMRAGAVLGLIRKGLQLPIKWFAAGVAAVGARAARQYAAVVGHRRPVWNLPYVCDLEAYWRAAEGRPIRSDSVRFLYCGQLIERKGVDLLLAAFVELLAARGGESKAYLTLLGEGPLRKELMSRIPVALRDRVDFAGFRQPPELPDIFAAHDVFVLPSRHDGWGVVLNQAMAAGLALIVADGVQSADDVLRDKENGLLVRSGDKQSLTAAVEWFVDRPHLATEYGEVSRKMSNSLSLDVVAGKWIDALCAVAQ